MALTSSLNVSSLFDRAQILLQGLTDVQDSISGTFGGVDLTLAPPCIDTPHTRYLPHKEACADV